MPPKRRRTWLLGDRPLWTDEPNGALDPMELTAKQIIELLDLRPLPIEGGHFRQTHRGGLVLPSEALSPAYLEPHPISTTIYYMLTDDPDSFSALHRLPTDEIWHFYLGDPVELLLLHPDGSAQTVELGSDLAAGQQVQFVVPAESWQGARLAAGGKFALMGTSMAPGYIEADYKGGEREVLIAAYPDQTERIRELIRP